jgi:XTP/dITP diphosphohydrolase
VASHNSGKLREIAELFEGAGVSLVSAGSLGLPEPEETGDTFLANALLKSRAGALGSGKPALADDSGICVEALGGAPGIYSARWAGPNKSFADAMERVRRELEENGAKPPWRAYFISVLALSRPDGSDETFEGRVDGALVFPPCGDKGFGYDPIFLPDGETRTFGEMSAFEKHGLPRQGGRALSHRARAFLKAFPEVA